MVTLLANSDDALLSFKPSVSPLSAWDVDVDNGEWNNNVDAVSGKIVGKLRWRRRYNEGFPPECLPIVLLLSSAI